MSGTPDPRFTFRVAKDGTVRIARAGRVVTVIAGDRARTLVVKLRDASPDDVQQLLARATGDYRRGNERGGSSRAT